MLLARADAVIAQGGCLLRLHDLAIGTSPQFVATRQFRRQSGHLASKSASAILEVRG
jgi:hypothetical protein